VARGRPARATVYARLDTAITELRERFGGLPSPKESEPIWSDIWHLEAHHSTALEGNTLALREVQALLEQGRAVGAKPLREYLEVNGYSDAARWVYTQALEPGDWHDGNLISVQEVRHIHVLAMTPVWQITPHPDATDREGPGQFREHDIRPFGGGMTPPSWPLVGARVQDWVDGLNEREDTLRSPNPGQSLPEPLAQVHNEFERVHPFIDGNGRTGRLVLNLVLVRLGYPPVIVLKQQRAQYLAAMQKADEGDFGANCWHARCTTTSTGSSSPTSRGRRVLCLSPPWSMRPTAWRRFVKPRSEAGSTQSKDRTGCGAALGGQSRRTTEKKGRDAANDGELPCMPPIVPGSCTM
jgi:hypothetical protein